MKRILKIIALGTGLGVILLIVQKAFQIDEGAFMRGYWILAPAVVACAVLVNVLYNLSYQRKLQGILPLLEAGKPLEYIAEAEKLLRTAKGEGLRNILKLDLAAGYMNAKQYDAAVKLLEELSGKRLSNPAVRMIHRLNLCLSYFHSAQYEKALALYNDSREIFEPYRNGEAYGGNIAVVDILAAIRSGQYEQAEQQLAAARDAWSHPRLQEAFRLLGDSLTEAKKTDIRPQDN